MFQNYFKIAFRSFIRNPLYTSINVLGLAIGMTFGLLLFLGLYDEISIDQFHEEGDQIYRTFFNGVEENGEITFTQPWCPYPLYTTLKEMKGVENSAFATNMNESMIEVDGKNFKQDGVWGSLSIFEIFSFPIIAGGLEAGRTNLQSAYISEKVAERFFGKHWKNNAVGKTVRVNKDYDCLIAGVFQDIGKNASYQFDFLINADVLPSFKPEEWVDNWGNKNAAVFAKLSKSVDPKSVEEQINPIYKESNGYGIGGEAVMLVPFDKTYLWSKFENGKMIGGRIEYVRILLGAALFLLFIACINFINLATAQAAKRAKEVGVRKTIGANKFQLVLQFMSETGIIVLIALLLSLTSVNHLLPGVNALTEKTLYIPWENAWFVVLLLVLALILTLLAGLYPSFILSNFKPVKVLKNNLSAKYTHKNIRRALVVFQFVLSAILIMSTLIVDQQLDFIKQQNLGLNRNNIIHFNMPNTHKDKYQIVKDKLESKAAVSHVIKTSSLPTDVNWIYTDFEWEGRNPDDGAYFYMLFTEFDFDEVTGIKMKEGRFFDEQIISDKNGIVLNEKALDFIQMEDPVGKTLRDDNGEELTILGIAKNFNFRSIHNEIEPLMIRINPDYAQTVLIKSKPEETAETITLLKSIWKEIIPDYPLEYHFLDESYSKMYTIETVMGKLSKYLSAIAILISCLGLLGLITFMANQRAKEIGIRKVLGASIAQIVTLLSKDFMKLIMLGLFIAIPFAWYLMDMWLSNYAYRIEIKWTVFVIAGIIAIGIALLTISYQSIKAALENPVNSLKNE